MRRFLLHVLSCGFHRIRHYGLLVSGARRDSLTLARELLHVIPGASGHRFGVTSGRYPTTLNTRCHCRWQVVEPEA
jgi:hypothetical protein